MLRAGIVAGHRGALLGRCRPTPCDTPLALLAPQGFDAVTVLNHELCAAFDDVAGPNASSPSVFPNGTAARGWLEVVRAGKKAELQAYKARGLRVISKLDMVVL